jgi:beta-N-acetylhexosaminidase
MVSHAEVPGLTAENEPASLSSNAIRLELRQREGFEGVVITDDLGMGAIEIPQADAALEAITAGADIALVSGSTAAAEAHAKLVAAIEDGSIDAEQVEASVRRVLRMRGVEGECFDAVSAYAEATRLQNEAIAAEAEAKAGTTAEPGTTAKSGTTAKPGTTAEPASEDG